MVVRINQISDLLCHNIRLTNSVKESCRHAENPVERCLKDIRYDSQMLAKTMIRDTSLGKSVLSLPAVNKSDIVFETAGNFNRKNYARSYEQSMQEMKEALYCVDDKELAKKIKSTGDLYSLDEVSKIEELVQSGIPVEDAIRCRGSEELLQVLDGNVKLEPEMTIKHMVEEYVNKLAVFKEKDKNNFQECTKKINKFIESKTEYVKDSVLYRGEQSEVEIHRLLSLALEKQLNPHKTVKYAPNHLFSTTNRLETLTQDYDYADKCLIKIVGTEGKCKGIDVNKMIGSKNKFFSQNEILLSSTSEFEVVEGVIDNGRLVVTLKYAG